VQATDQEAQAQLAFSTFGARAWCKLQIKRLKPNSRFQGLGQGHGASCRSRGSGPTRVFNVWGEGMVQAANQEAQAQLAFSTSAARAWCKVQVAFSMFGARAWCKLQIKRLRPNSCFQRVVRRLGASCRLRGSGPTRVFNGWGEGLVQGADQEAQA